MGTDEIALEAGRLVAVHSVADGAEERTVVFCHPAPGAGGFDPDPGRRRHASRSRRNATAIATTSTPACTARPVASQAPVHQPRCRTSTA
jgi:hypothetical protein